MNPLAHEEAKDVKSAADFYHGNAAVNAQAVFLKGSTDNTRAWQQACQRAPWRRMLHVI